MEEPTDHRAEAKRVLNEWCSPVSTTAESAAIAQVHATLALVDAVALVAKATKDIADYLGEAADRERGW